MKRALLALALIIGGNVAFSQGDSFWINQLGSPLKNVISRIKQYKQLEPVYISSYGSVEYKDAFYEKRRGILTIYFSDDLVYRLHYFFSPDTWDNAIESRISLFDIMYKDLSAKYGEAEFSDPYHKYGLGRNYLKVAHWVLDGNIIMLSQNHYTDLVSLTYTHILLFEEYIGF